MKKVLITGGAGFIALQLAKKLMESGYSVSLVDNYSRGVKDIELKEVLENSQASFHELDCLDEKSLEYLPNDFAYIFHMAAIIGVRHVEERPDKVLTENLRLLENILDVAERQKNLKRFLFASTSEVYAGTLENFQLPIPTPESAALALTELSRPRTSYMLSKISGEALCHYRPVPTTIFRPHNIYGPRMGTSHVVPGQLQKAHESPVGSEIPVPSAEQTRTFCYIDDAVEMLVRMMESQNCEGETLNLGNQDPEVTIQELVKVCHRVVGKNQTVLSKPSVPGSPQRRCPDMTRTISLIGYTPTVSLEEGIRRTYDWYSRNVFEGDGVTAQ